MSQGYQVQLPIFAGPLDLLLHLIERSELDIYDIPINTITDQFLSYLRTMELLNLELAGEFLLMAATLMQIKAKMLLPRPISLSDGTEEEEEDPRRELVDRLVEYKRIKEAAALLRQREEEQALSYARQGGIFADQITAELPAESQEMSIWDLIQILQDMLVQAEEEGQPGLNLPEEQISVRQIMGDLLAILGDEGSVEFAVFLKKYRVKRALICAFMALLELMRLGRVIAYQDRVFGRILISLRKMELNTA